MSARQTFNKATLLLDRGKLDAGECALRAALDEARREEDLYDQTQILCCLGELLRNTHRTEAAKDVLRLAVTVAKTAGLLQEEEQAQIALSELEP